MKYTAKTNMKRQKRLSAKPLWLTVLAIVLLGAGAIALLEVTGVVHWFRKPAAEVIVTAGHPTPPPANNVSGKQSTPVKQPTSNTGSVIGGGTDTSGQSSGSSSTNSSQWTTSESGNITVEQPVANATLHSGDTISGTAKVSAVNFRLIDTATGVISEGTFNVVNGNFSGTLTFTPHSNSGRLDIFNTSSDGAELNEVQISVGLSS